MLTAREDKHCYASPVQREVLIDLIRNGAVSDDFFLTGGTALSVFHLHHRQSNDLDFFTLQGMELAQIDFLLKTTWGHEYVKIKDAANFLSVLIRDVKVDFVVDRLSLHDDRERYALDPLHHLRLDTPRNIVSNKLCAIASRFEPKDYVDYYSLCAALQITSFEGVLDDARKKDAIFDDPPTAAYQIEQGLQFLRHHPETNPPLRVPIDQQEFDFFYERMIRWLYELAAKR
jgi:hypothetical protein